MLVVDLSGRRRPGAERAREGRGGWAKRIPCVLEVAVLVVCLFFFLTKGGECGVFIQLTLRFIR